jgi:hypothetical protein
LSAVAVNSITNDDLSGTFVPVEPVDDDLNNSCRFAFLDSQYFFSQLLFNTSSIKTHIANIKIIIYKEIIYFIMNKIYFFLLFNKCLKKFYF